MILSVRVTAFDKNVFKVKSFHLVPLPPTLCSITKSKFYQDGSPFKSHESDFNELKYIFLSNCAKKILPIKYGMLQKFYSSYLISNAHQSSISTKKYLLKAYKYFSKVNDEKNHITMTSGNHYIDR